MISHIRRVSFVAVAIAFASLFGAGTLRSYSGPPTIVRGQATVIDGDTIEIQGSRIRLAAVDAPESDQLCENDVGRRYRCGQTASFALADFIGRSLVTCTAEVDRYGKPQTSYERTIAACQVNGADLGAWLVERGWAVPYWTYGGARYRRQYEHARQTRVGIWAGRFEDPSEHRARKRAPQ
jgi:endonuclease YncB( thermonuclease family)